MKTLAHMESSSLTQPLAAFFAGQPGIWIDGRQLAKIAGSYAWRTRVSDIRRPPFCLNIVNRVRHIKTSDESFIVSEYKLEPTKSSGAA